MNFIKSFFAAIAGIFTRTTERVMSSSGLLEIALYAYIDKSSNKRKTIAEIFSIIDDIEEYAEYMNGSLVPEQYILEYARERIVIKDLPPARQLAAQSLLDEIIASIPQSQKETTGGGNNAMHIGNMLDTLRDAATRYPL